ncbi:hypothetical protein NPIL_345851 [Nephila pilipes]|uniref:Uncharacterized protein n=1 Tax=Nephila pilipes TaxID=299642 RepID=A0A8X6TKH0_NEPPI|nr:hypothetical protein NPIL_345851 [Nephila pilipes]
MKTHQEESTRFPGERTDQKQAYTMPTDILRHLNQICCWCPPSQHRRKAAPIWAPLGIISLTQNKPGARALNRRLSFSHHVSKQRIDAEQQDHTAERSHISGAASLDLHLITHDSDNEALRLNFPAYGKQRHPVVTFRLNNGPLHHIQKISDLEIVTKPFCAHIKIRTQCLNEASILKHLVTPYLSDPRSTQITTKAETSVTLSQQ